MMSLYWLTRVDDIKLLAGTILAISSAFVLASLILYLNEPDNEACKAVKISTSVFIISLLMFMFIPNKKDLMLIYGLGGTIEYLKSNDTAKQLPDKCIKVLDKWAEEQLKENINDKRGNK